jgi:hypothetical protein
VLWWSITFKIYVLCFFGSIVLRTIRKRRAQRREEKAAAKENFLHQVEEEVAFCTLPLLTSTKIHGRSEFMTALALSSAASAASFAIFDSRLMARRMNPARRIHLSAHRHGDLRLSYSARKL